MAIPTPLLNSRGGGLDIKAECKDGQGARGPTVDYGQWDNAKGAKLKRLSNTDKMQKLADMVRQAKEYLNSESTLDNVELLELRATNAMYTAREGAAELAQVAQECQRGNELKKLCKDLLKYYIRDREEYAKFLTTAATISLDTIRKSLDENKDADAKSKVAQQLQDWLTRLQDKLDAKVKELEAIKSGNTIGLPGDNAKFLAIEKEALQSELGVMKKGLKKIVNDVTALEAKESLGITPSGSKDKSASQRFKDWLAKTWAKVSPSGANDGEGADNGGDDDFEEPPKHRVPGTRPKPGTSNNGEGDGNGGDDGVEEPPKHPGTKPNRPARPSTQEGGDGNGGDDGVEEPPKHPGTKPNRPARPSTQEGGDGNSSSGTKPKPKPKPKPKAGN
ncbi:hypothetical protein MY11210_004319 [Beauveria gryllotalpidicola]